LLDSLVDWLRTVFGDDAKKLIGLLLPLLGAVVVGKHGKVVLTAAIIKRALQAGLDAMIESMMRGDSRQKQVGNAGEAIVREVFSWLRDKELGTGTSFNLNELVENFPLLDLIDREGIYSVKTLGILTDQSAAKGYVAGYRDVIWEGGSKGPKYAQAAELLHKFGQQLRSQGQWPDALPKNASLKTIEKYVREKTILVVPSDHVQPARRALGKSLLRESRRTGLTVGQIQNETWRIRSSGIKSKEIKALVKIVEELRELSAGSKAKR
jgi:hypothetical protein